MTSQPTGSLSEIRLQWLTLSRDCADMYVDCVLIITLPQSELARSRTTLVSVSFWKLGNREMATYRDW